MRLSCNNRKRRLFERASDCDEGWFIDAGRGGGGLGGGGGGGKGGWKGSASLASLLKFSAQEALRRWVMRISCG